MPRCESSHLTSAPTPPADRTKRPVAVPDAELPALDWPEMSESESAWIASTNQHFAPTLFSIQLKTRLAHPIQVLHQSQALGLLRSQVHLV